jgi:predicted DNA-binding protein YlxM (UPF0122 family)
MQPNKTIILEWIYTNKLLNDAIKNVVDWRYRDDFKSHFIMQIVNTREQKLIDLYKKGQLDWFCLRVITNQWKSTNSSFWKIYRNGGFAGSNLIILDPESHRYDNEVEEDNITIDEVELKIKVKKLLLEQYVDFYANQYHKTLFELYYFDKKNLRQISEETDIKICSISRSIRKTKKYIKNKLQDELY